MSLIFAGSCAQCLSLAWCSAFKVENMEFYLFKPKNVRTF